MKVLLELECRELVKREGIFDRRTGASMQGQPGDVLVQIGTASMLVPKADYEKALVDEPEEDLGHLDPSFSPGGTDPEPDPPNRVDTNKAKGRKKKSKKG